jgi:hypothetical protein
MKTWAFLFLCASITLHADENQTTRIAQHESEIAQNPSNGSHHFAFGEYLASLDQQNYYQKAFDHFKTATQLEPRNLQWLFRFGTFACRIGEFNESIEAYKTILTHHPDLTSVLYNAGFTFKTAGQIEFAARIYAYILTKHPEYEPARLGLAFALLAQGEYKKGWEKHLWNIQKQGKDSPELRQFIADGTLHGKRILLIPEGGLGDTLQFIRYAQCIKQMGAHVTVSVQRPLLKLLSGCTYIDSLVSPGDPVSPFDAKATLMSLPAFFQDTEDTLPQNIPYISPNQERVAYWKNKLQNDHTFKIGICWQPDTHNDVSRLAIARRGIPLSFFHTLGSTPGVTLYSLQKHEGLDQLSELPNQVTVKTFDNQFDVTHGSFVDTAAVMQSLDLIISTDTATAHLAGAMGKKVWLLLPFNTDWRWLLDRLDTPWYPTMRIFKQTKPFDWNSVIEDLHSIFFNEIFQKQS